MTRNVDALRERVAFHDAVLIAFARREQGLLVASGNPLRIDGLPDAVAQGARMAMRPKGAGAQLLLVALLSRNGLSLSSLRAVDPVCPTGPDIAQAIRAGRADCSSARQRSRSAPTNSPVTMCRPPGRSDMRRNNPQHSPTHPPTSGCITFPAMARPPPGSTTSARCDSAISTELR